MRKKISVMTMAAMLGSTAFAKEKIVFWHAMGGNHQTALTKIVESYNKSQDKVEVEAIYQGSYEELLPKFKSVQGTAEAPAIAQLNEITTEYMYKSGAVTPMENFVMKENFDKSQLEDALVNYYTIDGKLFSMPFNSSSAVLMYNRAAFKEAGLDPDRAPKSYKEVAEYATKLTKGDRKGFALVMNSWFPEQLLANLGGHYVNNSNGRAGTATGVGYEDGSLEKVFTWLQGMYKAGTAESYGRDYSSTRTAFTSGKLAMYMDSSSGIAGIIKNADFEVGTAFIPNESGEFNGAIIGGASLWITNSVSDAKQNAAWDFIKYAVSKDVQAQWATDTGYYSVNKGAYSTDLLKETLKKYPQMGVASAQLKASKKGTATSGAVVGVFPELREKISEAMETVYEGKENVKAIVAATAKESNRIIQRYNRINK